MCEAVAQEAASNKKPCVKVSVKDIELKMFYKR